MSIPFGFHLLMTSTHKIHDRLVSSAQSTVQVTLCTDIRNGKIGRAEARSTYPISANLIQLWLKLGKCFALRALQSCRSEYLCTGSLELWTVPMIRACHEFCVSRS